MSLRFDLDPELIDIKEMPVLSEDELWMDFFATCRSFPVRRRYNRLVKLLSAENRITEDIQTAKHDKKKSLNTVFSLSQKANNEGDERAAVRMEEEKATIEALNERLEQLKARRHRLKEQITGTNFSLLKETVRISYGKIRKRESELENIAADMDALKARLNHLIDRKHGLEEEKSSLYRLVHALIGRDEADKLDRSYLE